MTNFRFTKILSGTERPVTVPVTFCWLPFERFCLYETQSPIFTHPWPYITKQKIIIIIIITSTHKTQLNLILTGTLNSDQGPG